jgi:NADPH:quinone reductase-like Zn-dependent oxidoreductase
LYHENKIKIFFDAVGGDAAGKNFALLPNGAILVSYGLLSLQPIG